ncbi:hypothetical protein ACVOMV_18285 [Mesorhizobium atlanticum]
MGQFDSEPVRDPADLGFDKTRLARLKQWMRRYSDTGRWYWRCGAHRPPRKARLFRLRRIR